MKLKVCLFAITYSFACFSYGAESAIQEVFKPVIAKVKTSKTPVYLPTRLPKDLLEKINTVRGYISPNGYGVSLYYRDDIISFTTQIGSFKGSNKLKIPAPHGQKVLLKGQIAGQFRPVSCGGSCAPANLWWQKEGYQYQIQLKLASNMDEVKQQQILTDIANAMVKVE